MRLRDIPVYPGTRQDLEVEYHRCRCLGCARIFREEIPFRYPEIRISELAATWISSFLHFDMPIAAVQRMTGIHRDTIHRIRKAIMDEATGNRRLELERE